MPLQSDLHKRHPPSVWETIGNNFHKQKRYDEAVQAFSASLSAQPANVSLLALRAATYEKLGNLSLALKDGREMIDKAPDNVKGYLTTGHLLKRMQNCALAEKIYQRGVRYCKSMDDQRKLRQKIAEINGVAQPTAVDPLEVLPREVIEMIFSYIPFDTLCLCVKVSQLWRNQLKSQWSLWTNVDFSRAKKPVRTKDFRQCLDWSQKRLKHAVLKHLQLQGSRAVEAVAKAGPSLSSLCLLSGGELSDSLMRGLRKLPDLQVLELVNPVMVSVETLHLALDACSRLRKLLCHLNRVNYRLTTKAPVARNLEVVKIVHAHRGTDPQISLDLIIQLGKPLRLLYCEGGFTINDSYLESVERLEELHLIGCSIGIDTIAQRLTAIRVLECRTSLILEAGVLLHQRFWHIPNIERLSLDFVPNEIPHLGRAILWQNIIRRSPNFKSTSSALHELRLQGDCLSEEEMTEIIHCDLVANLKFLSLLNFIFLDDTNIGILVQKVRKLIELDVTGSQITGVGVKAIVTELKYLKRLDVSECLGISHDAVDWARNRGVLTTYRLS